MTTLFTTVPTARRACLQSSPSTPPKHATLLLSSPVAAGGCKLGPDCRLSCLKPSGLPLHHTFTASGACPQSNLGSLTINLGGTGSPR